MEFVLTQTDKKLFNMKILTAKSQVFWEVELCRLEQSQRRFV
jgi:hypothetical protein